MVALDSELIAEFETEKQNDIIENSTQFVDDLLLLVSFISRELCVCVGWETFNDKELIKFYRRDISIPTKKEIKSKYYDLLVNLGNFDEFIEQTYENFCSFKSKEFIRNAINQILNSFEQILESSFISLYSAIESIILYHRRENDLEFALDQDNFKDFYKGVKKYIKQHPLCENNPKRKYIYEKISELNRISFRSAFDNLCNKYQIDLSDLWPLIKNDIGISLTEIRNNIIHGESINMIQGEALVIAKFHLRWIAERIIIGILKWPLDKTELTPNSLIRTFPNPYLNWREASMVLKKEFIKSKETETNC